ncbi:MAG: hypothetical protein PHN56_00755 [Candidatus Nanoarchaeia archaeon]|nr:hypothetical protein [Candidatus Nanoarchaeia archaeon]
MVFRDYLVRCKRCKIPYIPKNVSRIKTCIFCRRCVSEDKTERLNIVKADIQKYYETQGIMPTNEIVKIWIKLKFDLSDKKTDEYYKFLEKQNVITISKKEKIAPISALNA